MSKTNYIMSELCEDHRVNLEAKVGENVKIRFELINPAKPDESKEMQAGTVRRNEEAANKKVGSESLWVLVTDVLEGDTVEETVYIGYINNDPVYLSAKYKDEVEFSQSHIAMLMQDDGAIVRPNQQVH